SSDKAAPIPAATPTIQHSFQTATVPLASAVPSLVPADLIPSQNDLAASLESQLVDEINRVRVQNGLPPYVASAELGAAARAHSCDLAVHHMISHTSSDGRVLADRLAGASSPWQWPSESIAAGTADAATVVAWWMDEPPEGWHRRNILDQQQHNVGAGYCFTAEDPTGNHHYWTADFARHPD